MLLDVNLPHKFWAEAVSTAAPTKAVKGTKPKCLDAMFLPIFRKRFSMEFLLHLSQLRKHIVECGVLSSNSEDSEEEKSRPTDTQEGKGSACARGLHVVPLKGRTALHYFVWPKQLGPTQCQRTKTGREIGEKSKIVTEP